MVSSAGTTPVVSTAAERIRSAWTTAQVLLAVDDAQPIALPICHLFDDGSTALAAAADAMPATPDDGAPALLELTDHAPLPLRERVRSLVWIRGRLRSVAPDEVGALLDRIACENPTPALLQVQSPRSVAAAPLELLQFSLESVVVADATGAESVPLAELLAARPDPLRSIEAHWLRHLHSSHPDVVARLAGRLPMQWQRGEIRPLGVDRYGIWLRVEDTDGDHDVRLSFDQPAYDVVGLNRAVRALLGCQFRSGLQMRRD